MQRYRSSWIYAFREGYVMHNFAEYETEKMPVVHVALYNFLLFYHSPQCSNRALD